MRAPSLLKSLEGKDTSQSEKAKSVVQLLKELVQNYIFQKSFYMCVSDKQQTAVSTVKFRV